MKKNFKYLTSLILAFMMIQMNFVVPAFAEDEVETEETTVQETVQTTKEVSFLKQLNIIGDEDLNAVISRGDFAVYVAKLLGQNESDGDDVRYFKDVDPNSRYAKSIHYLYENGIVYGKAEGVFGANDQISAFDAAVILLRVAGYSKIAENNGYDKYVYGNKLLKGINESDFTVSGAAKLICNALEMPVCSVKQITTGKDVSYFIDEETLLMNKLFSIHKVSGMIYGVYGLSLLENKQVPKNHIFIADQEYKLSEDLATEAYYDIGCHIEAYIQEDKNNDDTVVYYSVKDTVEKTEIMFSNLYSVEHIGSRLAITYDVNGSTKKKNFSYSDTNIIRNGKAVFDLKTEAFAKKVTQSEGTQKDLNGIVTIIESNDKVTITINNYRSVLVGSVDQSNELIYEKYGTPIDVSAENHTRVSIHLADGTIGTLADIKEGMFLTVVDKFENMIDIRVSPNVFTGTVQSVDEGTAIIDGTEYSVEGTYMNTIRNSIGKKGTFYLNVYDEIGCFKESYDAEYQYGFLIDAREKKDTLMLKVLTADGEVVKFTCAEKLVIDKSRKKTINAAISALEYDYKSSSGITSTIVSQVITYVLNENGEIKSIDTAKDYNTAKSGLRQTGALKSRKWYSAGRLMLPDIALKSNGIIFKTPAYESAATAGKDKFGVVKTVSNTSNYICEGYTCDAEGFYSDVLVMPIDVVTTPIEWSTHPLMVCDKVREKLNSDDEVIKYLTLAGSKTQNAADKGVKEYEISESFTTESTASEINVINSNYDGSKYNNTTKMRKFVNYTDVNQGDIVIIVFDSDNKICKIFMYYDYDDPEAKISDISKYKNSNDSGKFTAGYAVERDKDIVALSTVAPNSDVDYFAHYVGTSAGVGVFVFDDSLSKNAFYEGSFDDILTYAEVGMKASVVIPFTFDGWAREYFVYKNGLKN